MNESTADGSPAKKKKAKRVSARAPQPIGQCDWCPRPFFKQEEIQYVPGTSLTVCAPCKETGKQALGVVSQGLGALISHIRGRA